MSVRSSQGLTLPRHILVALALVIATVWALAAWDYGRSEEQALELVRRETNGLALAFANHAESTFRSIDHTLLMLREAWVASPADFARQLGAHRELTGDIAFHVAVIDGRGEVVFSSIGTPTERVFVGDREHVRQQLQGNDDRLFISRPVQGRVTKKWSILLTRPIIDRGRRAGVIAIAVDPDYFVKFYKDLGIGRNGAARMVRDTGELMARSTDAEKYIGQVFTESPYLKPNAPLTGSFRRRAQADGVDRLSSFVRLPHRGVTVVVGPSVEEALAPTRDRQKFVIAGAALLSLLLCFYGYQLRKTIVERDAAQRLIADQHERLALATTYNGIGIWDWNFRTGVLVWDESMFQLYRVRRDDFTSTEESWRRAVLPEDLAASDRAFKAACDGTGSYDIVFRITWPSGEIRHIRAVARIVRDTDGAPERMLGTNIDITDKRLAELAQERAEAEKLRLLETYRDELETRVVERTKELAAARDTAEQASRAKSVLLANMSHEFRTPLNQVVGINSLLRREITSEKGLGFLDRQAEAATKLLKLITNLLDSVLLETDRLELADQNFNLEEMLEGVTAALEQRLHDKGLTLVRDHAALAQCWLHGDPGRLAMVIDELVDNAIKFSTSGPITLRVRELRDVGALVTLRFEIEDLGIGIAPEIRDRMFGLFVQLDGSSTRKYGGTGLGLRLCERLVSLMAGCIGVESTPGQGSMFWIEVPLKKGAPEGRKEVLAPAALIAARTALIELLALLHARDALARTRWQEIRADSAQQLGSSMDAFERAMAVPDFDLAADLLEKQLYPEAGPVSA